MTNEEKIHYWINLSDYDLETADAVLQTKRYLYVGFMCHQVVEKIFKACYAKWKEDTPPFTHGLRYIAEQGGFWEKLSESQMNFIDLIEPLNIKARYPDYKNELAKRMTGERCVALFEQTQKLQQWIKKTLL